MQMLDGFHAARCSAGSRSSGRTITWLRDMQMVAWAWDKQEGCKYSTLLFIFFPPSKLKRNAKSFSAACMTGSLSWWETALQNPESASGRSLDGSWKNSTGYWRNSVTVWWMETHGPSQALGNRETWVHFHMRAMEKMFPPAHLGRKGMMAKLKKHFIDLNIQTRCDTNAAKCSQLQPDGTFHGDEKGK